MMPLTLGPAKAISTGAFGAGSVVLIYIAQQFGFQVPPEVAAAFTTLISAAATWFTPTRVK